jgi:glycosyltransferase involved in cell wall biosynthesis
VGELGRRFSVLVPARDEERNIGDCLAALDASPLRPTEVLVLDDGSTDRTAEIVANATLPELRLLRNTNLPPGWIGKVHACHRLAAEATGDVLLFLDADTRLEPEGIARIASLFQDYGADIVTAVPRQEVRTWAERLLLPVLHLTYAAWLPMPLVWRTRDPRLLAANGQVLAITRQALDRIGGFAAVRHEVVDDMAICRRAKRAGLRVVFADGHHLATTRMYRSAREVWDGFSKNLYEGIGGRPHALAGVIACTQFRSCSRTWCSSVRCSVRARSGVRRSSASAPTSRCARSSRFGTGSRSKESSCTRCRSWRSWWWPSTRGTGINRAPSVGAGRTYAARSARGSG